MLVSVFASFFLPEPSSIPVFFPSADGVATLIRFDLHIMKCWKYSVVPGLGRFKKPDGCNTSLGVKQSCKRWGRGRKAIICAARKP